VCRQIAAGFDGWSYNASAQWWTDLKTKCEENKKRTQEQLAEPDNPMNYYHALTKVYNTIPANAVIIGEGANTMDIGRTIFQTVKPRTRLDAGTFGTMGVGIGQCIAAKLVYPKR
jgi:2-hydroxyacyl-CoA lyase 1